MRYFPTFLIAILLSSAMVRPSNAQSTANNDGEVALHGTGTDTIGRALVQSLNCTGGYSPLVYLGGNSVSIPEPTDLVDQNSTFNCATNDLFIGFIAHYLATDSETSRSAWLVPGTLTSLPAFMTPPTFPNAFGTWNSVQFAIIDSSVTDGDLTAYDTGNGKNFGGAPIMIPMYALPVAIAYSPTYGASGTTGHSYTFNIQYPQALLGSYAGGLRMSQATYCGVFNGTIRNFNNAAFTADNGGVSLRDIYDESDNPGRWASDGVPVRLVGRLDRSGMTDIFTRALAAQCGTTGNNYKKNAETLPYNRNESSATLPNFSSIRANTGLSPTSTVPEAGNGTATLVGAEYWNGSAIVTPAANAGKPSSQPNGANGSGRFLVADGSARVASAILAAPDYASPSRPAVKLNGKIGYIGAEFIDGSPFAAGGLKAAALKGGTSTTWFLPSAANASTALSAILPPQSAASGALNDSTTDTRQVRIPTYLGGNGVTTGNATRSNPFAWYDVLYGTISLSNPVNGYPITGTAQLLGYTCYKRDATGSNANALINFLNFNTDYIATTDGNGISRQGLFTRTATAYINAGLLTRSNVGALPNPWKHAVRQTFLVNSSETSSVNTTLGGYRLFLSNGGASATNSTCTSKAGV